MAGQRARGARWPRPRSQYFLRTGALAAELVRDACVDTDDLVLDLGAGSGRLTAALANSARRVIAVELDPVWAERLRGRWPNVDLIEGDAALVPLPDEPFRVLANPPFNRTTDLLRRLLDDPRTPLQRADLIVEWGVAMKRALPWPSTVNDVCWGAFYEASVSRYLPRTMFDPTPGVDAGVLVFRRRTVSLIPPELAGHYRRFVGHGFRHGLASIAHARAISQLGGRRVQPRELDPHQWAELFRKQSPQH